MFTAPADGVGWLGLAVLWAMYIAGLGLFAWKMIFPAVWVWVINHPPRPARTTSSFPARITVTPIRDARMIRLDSNGDPTGEWHPIPLHTLKTIKACAGTVQNPSDPSPRRRQR